ncbi:hypothetical protein BDR06DRAFT_972395 [Suillus hirtellus]|nr:hypothetical protein BDR06DRAFT_972395 [Suillus hirtellus]
MSFLALFNKSAQPLHYKLLAHLTAYNGSIHALAISNDGHLLACGGTEGIKIWDIKSRKELTSLSNHHESRGTSHRFGTRDKMVQVLTLNTSLQLQPVFAVRLENTVPKSVVFADNRSIYVFRLYDGNFMKLKDEDGDIVQEISCKSVIGHAAVYSKRGVFVVDNATDGFTLYRLEGDGEPLRTFATGLPSVSVPKQVAFGEEGKAHDLNGRCTIASTSPVLGRGKTTIKIWVYDYAMPKVSKVPSGDYWSLSHILVIDSFLDSTLNRVHGYMTSATMINVADDFSQRVQAAMIFDEYVDIQKDKEGPTEGYIKNDIVMLQELAAKILELAQEADREIDKDDHRGKHDTDYPQAAKGDEEAKDLSPIQYM